ncbi:hypothetical protein ACWDR0_00265 [Streptomyces sp. NPDC003691]
MGEKTDAEYHRCLAEAGQLLDRRRYAKAATAAQRSAGRFGGTEFVTLHARALAADGQVGEAVDILSRALNSGADPRAARDLALLLWHRLGRPDDARDVCVLGLADDTAPAGPGQRGATEDELRLARVELATLYLRLAPRTGNGLWQALDDTGSTALRPADRLLITGFAHGLAGDGAVALRLLHAGLARDPYHPVGLYDLACTLARRGDTTAALATLHEAFRNGERRLAARFAHDPDLAEAATHPQSRAIREAPADWHTLWTLPVHHRHHPRTVRLALRPGAGDLAAAEVRRFGENVGQLLRHEPEHDRFTLGMPGDCDDLRLRGWDLHCALRSISPLLADAHWFQSDSNGGTGFFLDEFSLTGGVLHFTRTPLARGDARERLAALRERAGRAPDDARLEAAVARVCPSSGGDAA